MLYLYLFLVSTWRQRKEDFYLVYLSWVSNLMAPYYWLIVGFFTFEINLFFDLKRHLFIAICILYLNYKIVAFFNLGHFLQKIHYMYLHFFSFSIFYYVSVSIIIQLKYSFSTVISKMLNMILFQRKLQHNRKMKRVVEVIKKQITMPTLELGT